MRVDRLSGHHAFSPPSGASMSYHDDYKPYSTRHQPMSVDGLQPSSHTVPGPSANHVRSDQSTVPSQGMPACHAHSTHHDRNGITPKLESPSGEIATSPMEEETDEATSPSSPAKKGKKKDNSSGNNRCLPKKAKALLREWLEKNLEVCTARSEGLSSF